MPGTYTVRAEFKGFKAAEHSGLTVGVGQDVRVDLTLQPGEQTQTVTVTGDVPMVNTTSATLGGTIENAAIVDLPLNGRAFQKLLDFNPGMQQIPGGGTPAYNANGQRGTNVTWMLDGVDEINMAGGAGPTVGGNGGGVDGVTILSLDAIQEVNTIQSPKAEYGWMAGAVVNVGLKSGTNNVHGTAFGFFRNGALDARNAFLGPHFRKRLTISASTAPLSAARSRKISFSTSARTRAIATPWALPRLSTNQQIKQGSELPAAFLTQSLP